MYHLIHLISLILRPFKWRLLAVFQINTLKITGRAKPRDEYEKKEWSSCSQTGKVSMGPLGEPEQIQYTGGSRKYICRNTRWDPGATGAQALHDDYHRCMKNHRGGQVRDRGVGTPGESLQRAEIVPGSLPRKAGNGISFRNYSAEYSRNGLGYSA